MMTSVTTMARETLGTARETLGLPATTRILCPVCLHTFSWRQAERYRYDPDAEDAFQPVDGTQPSGPEGRLGVYRRCPGDPNPVHHLPEAYGDHGRPLVVAVVGESGAGKTHLLAAISGRLEQAALDPFGLRVQPVDPILHQAYLQANVFPLLNDGVELEATAPGRPLTFTDAVILTNTTTNRSRVVAFFDASGEDLGRLDSFTRFISSVDALLFVVDATRAPALALRSASAVGAVDASFIAVLNRLKASRYRRHRAFLPVPAAVVLSKADLLPHKPVVRRWMEHARTTPVLDAGQLTDESRDAYAFLHEHQATGSLAPVRDCMDVTLHFASATGMHAVNKQFSHIQPQRVLEPLLSLLAMTGILGDDRITGGKVGR